MTDQKMMPVAILGAGGAGVCTALELARDGIPSALFESSRQILRGASYVNEGKIHQGFIYAKDDPERTARRVAIGALSFRDLLGRWIDVDRALFRSTPFVYAVKRDSMLTMEQVRRHFDACVNVFQSEQDRTGQTYLGSEQRIGYRQLHEEELAAILNPEKFLGAFETTEYAVDPREIAASLRVAVERADEIEVNVQTCVERVLQRADGLFEIYYRSGGIVRKCGPFAQVVNTTWESRLTIDQSMGLALPPSRSFRHKFGNRILTPLKPSDLPSVTCILGPFGDIVNFADKGLFLSWYPIGMVSMHCGVAPPESWADISRQKRLDIFYRSFEKWVELCPKLRDLNFSEDEIDPVSGMIFALGDTDIDQESSLLHSRFDVGIYSKDGYHSVNTGKFALAPHFAAEAAQRVRSGFNH